jgi:hypothetical protein
MIDNLKKTEITLSWKRLENLASSNIHNIMQKKWFTFFCSLSILQGELPSNLQKQIAKKQKKAPRLPLYFSPFSLICQVVFKFKVYLK